MKDIVSYTLNGIKRKDWAEIRRICILKQISVKDILLDAIKKTIEESEDECQKNILLKK